MLKIFTLSALTVLSFSAFSVPELTKSDLNIHVQKTTNSTSVIKGDPFYVSKFNVRISGPDDNKVKGIAWVRDGCFFAVSDDGDRFPAGKMDGDMLGFIIQKSSFSYGEMEFKSKNKKIYDAIFIDWTPEECPK